MGQIGLSELIIVLFFAFIVVYVWWRIVAKTGHSGALSLLMLIPLVNLGFMLYLSFSEWPVEKELKLLRGQAGRTIP